MANLIALKLREQGLQLRDMASKKAKPAAIENAKVEMLKHHLPYACPELGRTSYRIYLDAI